MAGEIGWWTGNWDGGRTEVAEAIDLARQRHLGGLLGYAYSYEALYALSARIISAPRSL